MSNNGINKMGFAVTMDHHRIENNLEDLAFMIQQLAPNQCQPPHFCDPYSFTSHLIDQYPQLQDPYAGTLLENPFSQQPHQGWHDPYSETSIPDWLAPSYLENDSPSNQPYLEHQHMFHAPDPSDIALMEQPSSPLPEAESSLKDLVEQLAANNLQFQQRTESTFQSLETQLGQLVSTINELRSQDLGQLSSRPVADPKSNESANTFCNDQELSSVEPLPDDACEELSDLTHESPAIHIHSDDFHCIDCAGGLHKCDACIEIDEFLTLPDIGTSLDHEHPTTSLEFPMPPIEDDSFVEPIAQVDDAPELNIGSVVPLIQQPPTLKCKPFLETIESAYLEGEEKLPVTIANNLQPVQEKLVWTFVDTPMKEEVFPKHIGITIVPCLKNELVPMRIHDHFHRPFIESVLGQLASKSPHCLITTFSKQLQSFITPKGHEKPTFTCPFGTYAYRRIPFSPCHAPIIFQLSLILHSFFGYAALYMDMSQAGSPKKLPLQELGKLIVAP